jgi:hypothetical protein
MALETIPPEYYGESIDRIKRKMLRAYLTP